MNHSLGICLSGGGTRGIAHIGVLQALEENHISPDCLSGASAGALVGTLYAAGYSPQEILEIFKSSSLTRLFKPTLPTLGLIDNSYVDEMLGEYIETDDFASLKKRMFVSVTNLTTGRSEIIGDGPLFNVVVTSTSIPILFKSRQIGDFVYADGGVLNNLPVEPLEKYCDRIIGVNVCPVGAVGNFENLIDIGYRTLDLVMWNNVRPRLLLCDVVIEPQVGNFGFFDLKKADQIFEEGYKAAMKKMPEIQRIAEGRYNSTNPYRNRFRKTGVDTLEMSEPLSLWSRFVFFVRQFFHRFFG
ncbi:MAG: patatin-like phospholipase family protein [Bacteroidia bacterium]|nr:patatin-like phospholipase family protein [Bacteroidia bacterium]